MASTALQAYIASLDGLVAYWPLEDGAGVTNPVDLSANALHLTKTSSPTMASATSVVDSGGTSFSPTGSGGYLQRTVTAGTPLQLSSAVSFGFFIRPAALSTQRIGGRSSNWQMRLAASGALQWVVTVGGAASSLQAVSDANIATSDTWFVCGTYDGKEMKLYIDATVAAVRTNPGSINATTDAFTFGQGDGVYANGNLGHAFVLNRALSLGEQRGIIKLAKASALSAGSLFGDYERDTASSFIASSAFAGYCSLCGRAIREAEAKIRPSSSAGAARIAHPACHAFRMSSKAPVVAISQSSTETDYAGAAARLIWDSLEAFRDRVSPADTKYFNGTNMVANTASVTFKRSALGLATSVAYMTNYTRPQRGSWHIDFAKRLVNYILTFQQPNGSFNLGSGTIESHWQAWDIAQTYLLLRPYLDTNTATTWKNALIQVGDYMIGDGVGGSTDDLHWYVNGNFEAGLAPMVYDLLYRITGYTRYQDALTYQIAKAEAPVVSEVNNSTGHGLVVVRAPATPGGHLQTGKAATGLASSDTITSVGHGYSDGDPVMFSALSGGTGLLVDTLYIVRDATTDTFRLAPRKTVVTAGSAGTPTVFGTDTAIDFTTDITTATVHRTASGYFTEVNSGTPGHDFSYTQLALSFTSKWYTLTKHPKALYWSQLMLGDLEDRVDWGTVSAVQTGVNLGAGANQAILDARGGTRLNILTAWQTSGVPILKRQGRKGISDAMLAKHWASVRYQYDNAAFPNTLESYYRELHNDVFSGWIASASDWPGLPS